eukprot:2975643-Prorocentrum_lima.AAC.1
MTSSLVGSEMCIRDRYDTVNLVQATQADPAPPPANEAPGVQALYTPTEAAPDDDPMDDADPVLS